MPYLQLPNLKARFRICAETCQSRNRLDERRFAPGGEGKDKTVRSRKVVDIYDGYVRLGRRMNLF